MKTTGIRVFTLLFGMLILSGCGRQPATPEEFVQQYLEAAKAGDFERVLALHPMTQERNETEEVKRRNPSFFQKAAKEKGDELANEYRGASIAEVLPDQPVLGKCTVVVKNVHANVGIKGNILIMNQKFVLTKEDGRLVLEDIQ